MSRYIVYFELFGKKMKTTVIAENEDAARLSVKDKVVFHKVERVYTAADGRNAFNDIMDIIYGENNN
jgi:hypothetical protein